MSRSRYKMGRIIRSLDDLVSHELIMWIPSYIPPMRKVLSAGWVRSWQLNYAMIEIARGHIFEAKEVRV